MPLEPVQVTGYGAAVMRVVAYDQVFKCRAKIGPEPVPPATLFANQEKVHASVVARAVQAKEVDQALLWKALCKEVSQRFGEVHLCCPPARDVPDVF